MGPCDCSTKNGVMSILATLCMTAAWCFNVAAFSVCRFVKNEDGFFQNPSNASDNRWIKYVGLYTMEGPDGYCYAINWNEATSNWSYWTDSKLNSARACGGVAALLGVIFMCWMWCAMCCNCGRVNCIRKVFGLFALICAILSGLMFLIYQSFLCQQNDCGFSQGGGFTVAALVLYFLASVLCCAAPDADEDDDGPAPAAAAAAPDGSKTVEETKIEPKPEGPMDEEEAVEAMPPAQVN